jgi:serine/threonine-protein kinase
VALLIAAAAIGGLSIRHRWQTARRSAIAQGLIERVNTIEEFVRLTAMMPQHDTSPERARVHKMVEEIRGDAADMGEIGRDPGRYAQGRIHLILGEVDEAVDDLQSAWDSGFQSPEVATALGRALGLAYEKALRRTRHISDPELRRSSEDDAAQAFRDRALKLLQIAGPSELESPALTQALIAYYEGHFEDALEATSTAAIDTPWDWRIPRLSGDIHASAATRAAGDGDIDEALQHLKHAGNAYELTLEIARSDADAMTALCHRWLLEMEIRERNGDSGDGAFTRAEAACETARRTAPEDAAPWETTALLHWRRADSLNDRGLDPQAALAEADLAARKAIELSPDSAEGHHALGGSLTVAALNSASRGGNPEPLLAQAISHLEQAAAIEPGNPVIADDLGYAFDRRARYHLGLGQNPEADLEQALASYRRALVLSPRYANAHNNSGIAHWRRAMWERGSGLDPSNTLDLAEASFDHALEINPSYAYAWTNLGMSLRTRALVEFERGGDPSETLKRARQALKHAVTINPSIAYAHTETAAVELIAARFALKHQRRPDNPLAAAATAVRKAIKVNPLSSDAWRTSAEVHRFKAVALEQGGAVPRSEIARGLADVGRALELNPASWQAMITGAALHLLEKPKNRTRARELLDSAVTTNPLAEHDAEPLRQQ